jgi:hypothetical protein
VTRPVVPPTRDDPFARWASRVIGGPAGRRIASPAHPWWSAGRVLALVAVVTAALSLVRLQHCRVQGWTTPGQFVHACYSDVAVLHATVGGTPGAVLGLDPASPDGFAQPALTAYLLALLAVLARPLEGLSAVLSPAAEGVAVAPRVFLDLYAVVLAAALVVTVLAVVRLSGRRQWDGLLVAASPVVVLSGLVSADLLGVALGVLAVALWARDRPLLAGVVLGLAVAARFHVVLVGVALLLLALRGDRLREAATMLSTAAFVWAALNLPLAVLAPTAWTAPTRGWWSADPGYGSLLVVPRLLADEGVAVRPLTGPQSAVVSGVLVLVVVVLVAVWVLSAPRAPRLPVVVLVLVALTLVVGKTVPVQASLWLLPWAALAVPRWRDHLWWWAAEAVYVVSVWQFLVGLSEASRSLPAGYYAVALVGRLAAFAWLAWCAWQRDRHPRTDGVRLAARGGDPAAGALARGRDRVVVQLT